MTIDELRGFFNKQRWIFAVTYAKRAPHEYIVRDNINGTDEEFMKIAKFIQERGVVMHFWGHPNHYIYLDGMHYWVMKDGDNDPTMIINRGRTSDYKLSIMWKGLENK